MERRISKQMKKQVNKFFAFFLALVMVLTSLVTTPMVANAEGDAEETESGTELTVHFKNEQEWETVYAMFGSGTSWDAITGLEYCKNNYGGIISGNASNEGWYSFKVTSETAITELNGNFNCGAWNSETESNNQTGNYTITVASGTEVWIAYTGTEDNSVTVSYDAPEGWTVGAEVAAPTDPTLTDTGVFESDKTKLKLYYYIEKDAGTYEDYACNVWNNAKLTEAGSYLTITAWGNQTYRKLLDTNLEDTVGWGGKWAYVGLDSNDINGLQFLTVDGGDNVWNSEITNQNLTEAYYLPGFGWYSAPTCNDDEEVKVPELQDEFYIVGGVPESSTGNAALLGNWGIKDGVKMNKVSDGVYQVTIALTAGTYEFTPVQDPMQFAWSHQFKEFIGIIDEKEVWSNYSITVEEDCEVIFTVKNPDISTGKAEVTTEVKKDDSGDDPKEEDPNQDKAKTFTVTFKNGEEVLKTETVEEGKDATAPALPTKTGYTGSWDKEFSKVTADTVVTVKWTANTYTLTYDVNGGSKLATTTKQITYDETYGELATPKRKGYTFKGWYTAKTKGTKVTSSTKVTGDATIYAQWKKVTKPGKVTVKSVKNSAKKTMKVTLKKVTGADGYEIRYSTKKSMKGAKKVTSKKTTVTIKKLKKGKTYYVQARAYKLDSAGNKVYSSKYSTIKKVKIKK